jgi:thiamine biosynthesis protein ThiI
MKYEVILLRYGELALKSSYVRKYFELMLIRNIKNALSFENIPHTIRNEPGRIYLMTADISRCVEILLRIFGIVSFSPAFQTTSAMDDISRGALQLVKNILTKQKSFAIRPTRVGNHPFSSQDVAIRIGNDIVNTTQAKVDLTHPDIELFIEIRDKKSFLFTEKIHGVGGLPLGTQGNIISIVEKPSSLLAAWYLMRRGCNVIVVNTGKSNEQAIQSFLHYWYADAETIYIDPARIDFYQHLNSLAFQKKCDALVTGHTLEEADFSLTTIANLKKYCGLPILSPLIALTSEEIQQQCRKRGLLV